MPITDHINIREFKGSDTNFLLDSSIQCLSKYTESIFKGWNYPDIRNHLEHIVLYILNNPDCFTFIACHKDEPDNIVSYIVADPIKNHIYLQYTKYNFRKLGIQKTLLLPLSVDTTKPISIEWPTKEVLKLHKLDRISVKSRFWEGLIQ